MENTRGQILCDKELGLGLSIANPQKRIRYPSLAKRAISMKMASESVSEEMRVLYVAMTRARDRLVLTYASQHLESDLKDIVLRQDFDNGESVCQEATCMGDWVLLAALQRTEAGMLHRISGKPNQTYIGDYPWYITVCQAPQPETVPSKDSQGESKIPEEYITRIREGLAFQYPYLSATQTPSKQTATSLKGRDKDQEASENTKEQSSVIRKWRSPSFVTSQTSGREYGNVMHTILQYIAYEKCRDLLGIKSEISRLVEKGFLTAEQAESVDPEKLLLFFKSEIGSKLCGGTPYVREFKFSILDDGTKYDAALHGEQVLLQGVVDCALLEENGITVIDFKTDYVTEGTLYDVVSTYRIQIETYADALQRIFKQPVKAKLLYFFRLNRFVEV